ncbi:hypothetical protein [Stieleria varia]|uniref:Uncharacterized protein n=1 Tax=Stieleria varia TaxID=2528005 RepID=A0A5C6AZ29_9BACT|nr:hypothetical protein [Stieleria varia]TWU04382.1 hypothetical protein Pla52n_24220 [Stieleria varia]
MLSLFGKRKKSIECCYCAKMMRIVEDADRCECGKEENPRFYMQDYAIAKPFYVPIVGWSSVGKTVWLHSLTRRMRELSRTAWDQFTPTPANEATMRFQKAVEESIRRKELPEMTQLGVQEAYIMVLSKMPYWGSRTFVLRDCGGENFNDFEIPETQVPFLLNTRTSFFMFSLSDFQDETTDSSSRSMEQLLQGYVNTLLKYNANVRQERRKIIVILSKVDALKADLPKNLFEYTVSDPIALAANNGTKLAGFDSAGMNDYMKVLQRVSDQIREWLSSRTDGKQFINFANNQNIDLRFTVVSSLGGSAQGDRTEQWEPYRVLDPFFWALDLHSN